MSSFLQLAGRNWAVFSHPQAAKASDALRIGLLGASNIAPLAVIAPAKSHPEVIIAAIAARDEKKAHAYAKKHSIPIVHKSYQDVLDDPAIDAIYIPLPNGLHYEWAIKSIKAGKHVLLEKPSTSNATEAASLFRHELLAQPNHPVVLEAFHVRFHPAWQTFLSLLDPPNITSAHSSCTLFKGIFPNDDIRFIYSLAGGTLMDLGTYNVLCLRQMLGAEPEECIEAIPRMMPQGYDQGCDQAFKIKWRFPNGAVGDIEADLSARGGYPFSWITGGWPTMRLPKCTAVHREVVVQDDAGLSSRQEHVYVRTVTMWNMMAPQHWHRIDISDSHTVRDVIDKKAVKSWIETSYKKAYSWSDLNDRKDPGEDYWTTYRHQLEQFVNRVRGRPGSGVWMDGEDSISQMGMIESAYEKAGLPRRPTSSYLEETHA